MKLSTELASAKSFILAKLFHKKTPLLASWEITRRCNARCKYCNIWCNPGPELGTAEILSLVRQMRAMGTRICHFTGGEPLIREDFGSILESCHRNGISTSVNSNASLVPQRIKDLTTLNVLGVSIDGPEAVHDLLRGEGSFQKAMSGIALARQKGIKVRLLTVLSSHNLDEVDFLLEKARQLDAPVAFQPATEFLLCSTARNPHTPDAQKYKDAIRGLIARKKTRQGRYIANSISGLSFLSEWPHIKEIKCLVPLVSYRIAADGGISICFRNPQSGTRANGPNPSLKDKFLLLPQLQCNLCCCASTVELNCLLSLKLDSLLNIWGSFCVPSLFSGERRRDAEP